MRRTAVINVVGLTSGLLGDRTPRMQAFASRGSLSTIKPAFPAVTCTAQSDYLTGTRPSKHGVVANGWYNREYSEVHFWKQSNHLVDSPKLWEELQALEPTFTCAKLFWWYNMYSSADYSITPRPIYPADGRKVFDVHTHPLPMREAIKKDLGDFPFHSFWGPEAGIESSEWIAASARWVENRYAPTLNLIYLPHLDYNLQRLGPNHPDIADDLQAIDRVTGELIEFFEQRAVRVVLLSEYGITEVDQSIHLNRRFRREGWITIKEELGLEYLDCGSSQVFAVADHQIAHIYIKNPDRIPTVKQLLENLDGVDRVLDEEGKREMGIDHPRSGDLVAVANERSWFTYYYWSDDRFAPDFARCVDIHRKPGYDPVELFLDPGLPVPLAKIAWFLLKKKLGFRALLDVIPLDSSLVRGSHGRIPGDKHDWPVLITGESSEHLPSSTTSENIYSILRSFLIEPSNQAAKK